MTMAEKATLIALIESAKATMDMLFSTKAEVMKVFRNEPNEIQQEILDIIEWEMRLEWYIQIRSVRSLGISMNKVSLDKKNIYTSSMIYFLDLID